MSASNDQKAEPKGDEKEVAQEVGDQVGTLSDVYEATINKLIRDTPVSDSAHAAIASFAVPDAKAAAMDKAVEQAAARKRYDVETIKYIEKLIKEYPTGGSNYSFYDERIAIPVFEKLVQGNYWVVYTVCDHRVEFKFGSIDGDRGYYDSEFEAGQTEL